VFGRVHPTKGFPFVSLLVLGGISIVACLLPLATVIDALIATRILVQFIGQVAGVVRLRRTRPDMPRPYRMWLYPIPAGVAFIGWLFVFLTTDPRVAGFGVGILALGAACFLVWSKGQRQWPFSGT
jgi:amino acid transporter